MWKINQNILVVDDDILSRKILQVMLENKWHTVTLSESWKDAIEKTRNEVFAIIFMDMYMPEMTWLEASKEIKNNCNLENIPKIVWLTAWIEKYIDYTEIFDLCIEKPITPEKLKQAINL